MTDDERAQLIVPIDNLVFMVSYMIDVVRQVCDENAAGRLLPDLHITGLRAQADLNERQLTRLRRTLAKAMIDPQTRVQ